jgi:hypothetical protein
MILDASLNAAPPKGEIIHSQGPPVRVSRIESALRALRCMHMTTSLLPCYSQSELRRLCPFILSPRRELRRSELRRSIVFCINSFQPLTEDLLGLG